MWTSYMRSQQRNNGNNGDSFDWEKYARNSRFRGSEADAVYNSSGSVREKHKILEDILREEQRKLKEAQELYDRAYKEYLEAKQKYDKGLIDKETFDASVSNLTKCEKSWKQQDEYCKSIKDKVNSTGFVGGIDRINKGLNTTVGNLKEIYGHIQHMVEPWAAADRAASKYAKTVAMTKAGMDSLRRTTIDNVVKSKLGINYNISTEELLEAQQNYVQSVGRSLRIDKTQQESLAAMHAVMGGRENELAVALENFGVSLNGTADHVGRMFADASKEGLSFEKYSDNVAKNIKIAQNYTFKNGLKGLESMAKKATAIKMDMGQIASLADRVSSVEGSIGVASKLQVLGGPFASAADPLGMMVEGLTDMEGLTDRITKMIGGLGKFNMETGEVEVSAFNKQRIKAAAEAMGVSYDQLMESVHASERRNQISKQIDASASASRLDDKMKELLKNSGTFENGKAGISVNGEFKSIDELTNEDYDTLVKETQDQAADIKDIARNLRSITDIEQGTKKQYQANKAQLTEKLGDGARLKKIVDLVGHSNFLLKIIAFGSFTKSIIGIIGNVAGAFGGIGTMFGRAGGGGFGSGGGGFGRGVGRNAGRFGNGIGSAAKARGTYINELGRSKVFKGTKAGDFMRRWGANAYKTGGKMNSAEAKAFEKMAYALGKKASEKTVTTAAGKTFTIASDGVMRNASGKVISGAAKKQVMKSAGKKVVEKAAGKVVAEKAATSAVKGGGIGTVLGIAGAIGNIKTDMDVESGKIEKGSAKHMRRKAGYSALEGAGMGIGAAALAGMASAAAGGSAVGPIGTAIGAVAGALIGATVGIVKVVKARREKKVDEKLEKLGIERKGNYGAHKLKLINKALDNGEISNRMRRKLEKKGDTAMLEAIDKKKEEIREKKRKEKNERLAAIFGGGGRSAIARGQFKVGTAYINANNISGGGLGLGGVPGLKVPGFSNFGFGTPKLFGLSNLAFKNLGEKIRNIKGKPETGDNKDTSKLLTAAKNLIGKDISSFGNLKTNANQKSSPMDVNINGTIRLVGANGKEVDITDELINDHNFIRALTNKITEQMGENRYGSNRQDNNSMGRTL